MRKLFVLAGVALTALLALSAPAAASSTSCNTTLVGATIPDDLVVPENGSCTIVGSTVGDDVRVGKNAFFQADNSQIGDDVTANRSAGVFINIGTTVGGDITTYKTSTVDVFGATVGEDIDVDRSDTSVHICGNEVADDIEVTNGSLQVLVGGGDANCEGNTVGDDVVVSRNKVGETFLIVNGNTVADDMDIKHNKGTTAFKTVDNNRGGDELECRGNEEPFTATGNTGWNETEGQCEIPPTECNSGDTPVVVAVPGDLVVPANGVCVITGSTVGGNVFVGKGGYFQSSNSEIAGDVRTNRSNGLFLDVGTTVGDEVDADNTFTVDVFGSRVGDDIEVERSSVHVHICGNLVGDDIEVSGSGPEVQVGDPAQDCGANTVGDDIEVERNNLPAGFGVLAVRGNTVADDLEVNFNRGGGEKLVTDNIGGDRLECRGNEQPFVGAPNAGFTTVEGDQSA